MTSISAYGSGAEISQSEITQYLSNNPYNPSSTEDALKLINNQYWAATFLNGLEAWANWRRSGYPDFAPADEEGATGGQPIRRFAYPRDEQNVNSSNYQEARNRQNIQQGNELTARVWWDCGAYSDQCNN